MHLLQKHVGETGKDCECKCPLLIGELGREHLSKPTKEVVSEMC